MRQSVLVSSFAFYCNCCTSHSPISVSISAADAIDNTHHARSQPVGSSSDAYSAGTSSSARPSSQMPQHPRRLAPSYTLSPSHFRAPQTPPRTVQLLSPSSSARRSGQTLVFQHTMALSAHLDGSDSPSTERTMPKGKGTLASADLAGDDFYITYYAL